MAVQRLAVCVAVTALGCTTDFPPVDEVCTSVAAVAAGREHTCAIAGGRLYCWGDNSYGQVGSGAARDGDAVAAPTRVGADDDWIAVDAGGDSSCGLRSGGRLFCWGRNDEGQLGVGDRDPHAEPSEVTSARLDGDDPAVPIVSWQFVALGGTFACGAATVDEARTFCWGDDSDSHTLALYDLPSDGDTTRPMAVDISAVGHLEALRAGEAVACGLRREEGVVDIVCWGSRAWGIRACGTADDCACDDEDCPCTIAGHCESSSWRSAVWPRYDWESLAVGPSHACGIKSDGALHCWGDNRRGQLGVGDTLAGREIAERVGEAGDWRSVHAGGGAHTCAIRGAARELHCWGANDAGQLGTGASPSEEPVTTGARVGGGWVSASLGREHTCAIDAEGGLHCWGSNASGQLGQGADVAEALAPRRTCIP